MAFEIANRIVSGRKAVATAGTAEQLLTAATHCFRIDVCADTNNTRAVVVGASNIVATPGSQIGTILLPGEVVPMYIDDVSKVYVDVQVDGEAVCYTYYVP